MNTTRCPSCHKDALRDWEDRITRMGIEIAAHGRRCSACSETLFDHEEIGRQEQELAALFVERGIRTGAEFAFVRKAAGFRAVEIAELFDVQLETVSCWEHDEGEIPPTAAYALGQLSTYPS